MFAAKKAAARVHSQRAFGGWDAAASFLVLAQDDQLLAYGAPDAKARLLRRMHEWVDLGMPSAASFTVRVYPVDQVVDPRPHEWLVRRTESQFLCSLDATPESYGSAGGEMRQT